jgi:hypothetical protein
MGVIQAVLVATCRVSRREDGVTAYVAGIRIIRCGGPSSLGRSLEGILGPVPGLTVDYSSTSLDPDHPIFHDPDYALPLLPEAIGGRRRGIPPVDHADFVLLAHSGIRNTPAWLWLALRDRESLGRMALGVHTNWAAHVLLAEGPPVTMELLGLAASAAAQEHRMKEFVIRPVADADPVLTDTRIVVPIRRYPLSPRSPATIMGEALPLAAGLDLSQGEIATLRSLVQDEGAVRASLAVVESRSVLGAYGQTGEYSRMLLESRRATVMLADGSWRFPGGGLERSDRLEKKIEASLGDRQVRVLVTALDDPLLEAEGYSIRLV